MRREAALRRPPCARTRRRVLFGSRDGWVYCLQASDGQLVWRFRAAPEERKMMAFEQLESTWPVHGSVLVQKGKKKARPKPSYVWSQPKVPLLVRAMALAGETLSVAGPPDHGLAEDEQSYLKHGSAEVQEKAQQQAEALAGKQGGLLWAVAKADGKRLAEHKLESPPVFDGMAAAGGRLYVAMLDGSVLCLGDRFVLRMD